ncbi:FKBP-type peptidyl-prolyl cis-trans isomerase [Pengzhenrongella sicca]|uniref:Peptidyl-prolyl cis-trans isomerase n=1 Tax=Pengzhenrongella sicca TaxID=2819238 RepID=A0A8A4ZIH7_9MICO|nr:FKBP-type peptidyl-prolyl cis-trans isomerase [Pengzhenrongella sicca]QTE30779.1 FKBP-type peptidyl-prolyl cis-trans isomerase [Pengzhenrongella sicca]
MRRLLVATLAAVLMLAGCTPDAPAPQVRVTGDATAEPVLDYTAPLDITTADAELVWAGDGPKLEDDGPVLLDYRLEKATDGSLVEETYTTVPKPFTMTPEILSEDLYDALSGESVGARILLLLPATSDTSSFASVMVVDVLPTRAAGEAVPPREGLPPVTLAQDGEPTIAAPQGEPPSSLVVQALIKGDGVQVEEGATVTVQFAGVRWLDGSVYDSSWTQAGPMSFDLGAGVLPGLAEGLVEQTVGSQVMLVIPPASGGAVGAETDTLVLVVDLLAASNPADADAAAAAEATPTPTGEAG